MFEKLKDESVNLDDAFDTINLFTPDELAQLKDEFNRSGDCRASVTRKKDGSPWFESLRLENVGGLVLLTVIDGRWGSVFVANECEELFK